MKIKKILILASNMNENKKNFINYLEKKFQGEVEVKLGIFPDLTFSIYKGNAIVEIGGRNIRDFDLVYFRNTIGFHGMAATLSIYLDSVGIKFFDRSFLNGSFTGDKFTSLMRLAVNDLPIPPSFYCWFGSIKKEKEKIGKILGFPIVAKELTAQRMQGVFLLKSLADFDNLPDKTKSGNTARYLFQKFVQIDNEFRVLVLGNSVGVVHTKTVRDNTGFQIGYADMNEYPEFLAVNDVPDAIKDIAIRAAQALDIQIAGVDVCLNEKSGEIYVFEVNRGPGFEYDTAVSPELKEVSKFLMKELLDDN